MWRMDEKGLGKRLQEARRAAGLTQQDLCNKAGLSYSTLAKIERGAIKSPSIFTIQSIAEALSVSLDTLLGHTAVAPVTQKRTSKNGVRFVYFDINGCLVRFYHRAFSELAQDTGLTADQVETAFWNYNDAACRGELTMQQFNEALARHLSLPSVDWAEYYFEAIEPTAGMDELVTWVAKNYHLGLLSNIMPGFIDTMRTRHILPPVTYDAVIDSSVVGAIKPEAAIFEEAQKQAKVEPHEILFIDDSRTNVMAASQLGWNVVWFDYYRPEEIIANIRQALEPAD